MIKNCLTPFGIMKKNNSVQKKLQEIFSQKKFEELELFRSTKSWKTLDETDRSLLASLFVMLGEKQLASGSSHSEESFDLACQVSPDNTEIFFRIGSAYSTEFNLPSLKKAEQFFQKTIQLDNNRFKAHVSLGNVYNNLGMLTHDSEFFSQAQICFNNANEMSQTETAEIQAHFFWHWGASFYCQGKHSGEAVDFFHAIEKFRLAAEFGFQEKAFWNTYGDSYSELALLIGNYDLFNFAVEFYRNAVRQAFDFFEGWLNLACVFQRLYEVYLTEDYYHQACECFKMASQINGSFPLLWLKWAQLLATEGKNQQEIALLRESFEKFAKADECDPHNPLILGLWGETLLLCGAQSESIELLREAQEKVMRSLEINAESPETWYIYGSCLYELGRYFNQEDYYHQAIDKFQFGLSIQQNEPLLWYGLAIACFAIGEIRGDIEWIEKSNGLFSRVLEFRGQGFKPLWNDWGIALMKLAEITAERSYLESAIEKFENIVPKNPADWKEEIINPEWLYNYGCALDFLGDFTEDFNDYELAVQALATVVQIDPEYTNARYNLALSLAHLGELARDVECFHKAIEQFQILLSQDSEDELGWADYGLTIVHLAQLIHDPSRPDQKQKLFEIAEGKFSQAIALGNTQALYHLACLHSLQENFLAALHFLDKAEAAHALPPIEQLLHDEWLDGVRTMPGFRHFINHIAAKKLPNQ